MDGYGFVNEIERNGVTYQCWRSITDPTDQIIVAVDDTKVKKAKPLKGKEPKVKAEAKANKPERIKGKLKNRWEELWRS